MTKAVGVWIDHRKAVIAVVSDEAEETKEIKSRVEKQAGGFADDSREREFTGRLGVYYDEVIGCIRDAELILIFGPGEAKGELRTRLEKAGLRGRIVAVETVDKMTDRQIAAKVREYFEK